jgi:hypothetical protein
VRGKKPALAKGRGVEIIKASNELNNSSAPLRLSPFSHHAAAETFLRGGIIRRFSKICRKR